VEKKTANFVFGGALNLWYKFEQGKVIRFFQVRGIEIESTIDGEVVPSLEKLETYLRNFTTFEGAGRAPNERFALISRSIQIPHDDSVERIAARILREADEGRWSLVFEPDFELRQVFLNIGGVSLRETGDSLQLKQAIGWHPF
jgi:hypothetical protein